MEFHYTVKTSLGVDEAVQSVTDGLKEVGFGVMWALDMQARLNEKGLEFTRPVRILEVCQSSKAKEALEDEVMLSYFLPILEKVFE